MSPQDSQLAKRQPGFLLLMVLVFLFLTSIVCVALLDVAARNIRSAAAASARDDLRVSAFSAMEIAQASLAELKELDENLHSPSQGWGNAGSYAPVQWPAGMEVTITITDETGKLPLNPPNRETLAQLLEMFGADYTASDELIDAYLDWTDEDDLERINGAEADYYERQDPSRTPPNQPITSFEAFRYIKGFDELFFEEDGRPNAMFKRFKESLSLNHGHPVNINTASPTILGMLEEHSGLDRDALDDLKAGPDGILGTDDDEWITSSSEIFSNEDAGVGNEAHVFRIVVRVEQGDKQFQLTALIDDGDNGFSSGGSDGSTNTGGGGNGGNTGTGDGGGNTGTGDADTDTDADTDENQPRVIYTNGQWRFIELTENGPEDG